MMQSGGTETRPLFRTIIRLTGLARDVRLGKLQSQNPHSLNRTGFFAVTTPASL